MREGEPRVAPDPETAEQRFRRLTREPARVTAAVGVGAVLAKVVADDLGHEFSRHPGMLAGAILALAFAFAIGVLLSLRRMRRNG